MRHILVLSAALVLVGAGCSTAAERLADDAVKPVTVPVQALGEAKETMERVQAMENEKAEKTSADMTVAFILTDGAEMKAVGEIGETIGCNDRVAMVSVHRALQSSIVVSDALESLFAVRDSSYQGLYNSLWQSELTVEDVRSPDGVVTDVYLKGKVRTGGACDVPRVKAQVEKTIARFRPNHRIHLNGSTVEWRCLGDTSGTCR